MKYGYARVSSKEQDLSVQISALKSYGVTEDCIRSEKVSGTSTKGRHELVVVKSFWPRVYSISNTDIPIHLGSIHNCMNAA